MPSEKEKTGKGRREAFCLEQSFFQPWFKPNASKSDFVESVNVCTELTLWYTHIWDDVKRKLQLILLENGTQFTYQTTKIIFEYFYPNLLDTRYSSSVLMFRIQSAVSIFSIALSGGRLFSYDFFFILSAV